jgi:proline dehydrogenase
MLVRVSSSDRARHLVETAPGARAIVGRYVAGIATDDAVAVCERLVDEGLQITVDHLGEDTTDANQAILVKESYLLLLERLAEAELTPMAEVSVKLSAIGLALPADGARIAQEHALAICAAAAKAGTTVTFDMEDPATVDATLAVVTEARRDFPRTGATLQACLRRTAGDCRDLAYEGSRVRLCKGAYRGPAAETYREKADIDRSYVRCMKILMHGAGYPMLATHDPRLVEIGGALAIRTARVADSYEYPMLYGVRPDEQHRLVANGERVRVYVPYGDEWYAYLVRRLAERPGNLRLFAHSLVSRA